MAQEIKKKNVIAVCCATLRELSVLDPLDAICQTANAYGLKVQIFQSFEELTEETELNRGEKTVFELINYEMLCGMIVFSEKIQNQEIVENLILKARLYGIPVVSFDKKMQHCCNLTFDYANAFEKIVRHLVEEHHFNDIFVMAGMKGNEFSEVRIEVVRKVLAEHGLTLTEHRIAYGDFWEIPTKAAMDKFFEENNPLPEAFIALNDTMATVIIDEVQKRGYRVPEDVAVTGFDGIFLAENYVPKITTAKQQYDVAGKKAVDLIKDYIDHKDMDYHDVSVPFKVQISQSCGCQDVDVSGVTGKIRGLHADFSTSKRFATYMDQMTRWMLAKRNMEGFLDAAQGYSGFVDLHDRMFLCLDKNFLKEDVSYIPVLEEAGISLDKDCDKDMVLVMETCRSGQNEHLGGLQEFSREEILPKAASVMELVPNMLITSLHVGYDIYGHVVMDYQIGNHDAYKTRMYVNKLDNMLFLLKQQWLLTSSNLELIRTKNKLEEMYGLDPMTGINNRRGFFQKYPGMLRGKKGGYVTVFSVDLDRLKPINDTYGHNEGDFAIKALSDALVDVVGDKGICARFGGDEFVALLYEAEESVDATTLFWNAMMERLSAIKEKNKKVYMLQCSLGAVTEPWDDSLVIENMISRSDKVLYEMKRKHHEEEEA
ncbi:MAG: GGDEF domain-containing protein [Lachnospiraceae bacterium]|nr:GGDEF domain-containing protein [Lachnospiraceae bacterium]